MKRFVMTVFTFGLFMLAFRASGQQAQPMVVIDSTMNSKGNLIPHHKIVYQYDSLGRRVYLTMNLWKENAYSIDYITHYTYGRLGADTTVATTRYHHFPDSIAGMDGVYTYYDQQKRRTKYGAKYTSAGVLVNSWYDYEYDARGCLTRILLETDFDATPVDKGVIDYSTDSNCNILSYNRHSTLRPYPPVYYVAEYDGNRITHSRSYNIGTDSTIYEEHFYTYDASGRLEIDQTGTSYRRVYAHDSENNKTLDRSEGSQDGGLTWIPYSESDMSYSGGTLTERTDYLNWIQADQYWYSAYVQTVILNAAGQKERVEYRDRRYGPQGLVSESITEFENFTLRCDGAVEIYTATLLYTTPPVLFEKVNTIYLGPAPCAHYTGPLLTVFPNPATQYANILFQDGSKTPSLRIFSITGQVVSEFQGSVNPVPIDISWLSPGIYFVEANDKGALYRCKMIKN